MIDHNQSTFVEFTINNIGPICNLKFAHFEDYAIYILFSYRTSSCETRIIKYSLRPSAGRFDLRLNSYSLTRETVKRGRVAKKWEPRSSQQTRKQKIKIEPLDSHEIQQQKMINPIKREFDVSIDAKSPVMSAIPLLKATPDLPAIPRTAMSMVHPSPLTSVTPYISLTSFPLSASDAPTHSLPSANSASTVTPQDAPFGPPKDEWKKAEDALRKILREHRKQPCAECKRLVDSQIQ